ncbi:site-specific integrase [Mycoplasmopsis cricetuli]|uniref:site-specific integrase n=1 Tax=Mycoplasmopsis cricetuli TaxID=171283 RepID=UPI0004718401|nr:site-specific integrase [Mycoplasmopsis cricetuli]
MKYLIKKRMINLYLKHIQNKNTKKCYTNVFNNLLTELNSEAVSVDDIIDFINQKNISNNSKNFYNSVFKTFVLWVNKKYNYNIKINQFEKYKKDTKIKVPLDLNGINFLKKELISYNNDVLTFFMLMCYENAARIGEVINADYNNLDENYSTFSRVEKIQNDEKRVIIIPQDLIEIYKKIDFQSIAINNSALNRRVSNFYVYLKKKYPNLPYSKYQINFQNMRTSRITFLDGLGLTSNDIIKITGHRSTNTIDQHYIKRNLIKGRQILSSVIKGEWEELININTIPKMAKNFSSLSSAFNIEVNKLKSRIVKLKEENKQLKKENQKLYKYFLNK